MTIIKHLKHPFNWLVLFGYGLLRLFVLLPYPWLMKIGAFVGYFIYCFFPGRRQIVEINIALCFPEKTTDEQKKLVKENFISMGVGFAEAALAYWGSTGKITKLCELLGTEHLDAALAQTGVIGLSCHMHSIELAARLANEISNHPACLTYRPINNQMTDDIVKSGRLKHAHCVIHYRDVRSIIKQLKQNRLIAYAPDQNFRSGDLFVPFFGIQKATISATSKIARLTKAKVIPFNFYRKHNYSGYVLEFLPPLEDFPTKDVYADTVKIHDTMESMIREHPEQYLWAHRRFRTRPPGEALLYPKKKKRRKKHHYA